jgi:phenylacetate-CoA ligase
MTPFEHVPDSLRRRLLFPTVSYLFNRKHVMRHYRELIQTERSPQESIEELQLKKLQDLLRFSNRHIPYYRKKFKEIGLDPSDIKSLADIKQFPLLSRQEVIDVHKEMVDSRLRASVDEAERRGGEPGIPLPFAVLRRHQLVRNTSSGSTGTPTVFYEDGSRTAWNWAHEFRLKRWFGIEPLAREARMVRLSTLYTEKDKIIRKRQWLWGQLIIPGMNLSDSDYSVCVRKILEFKPESLWGYTPALAGLAKYLKDSGGNFGDYKPKLAIGWASPLYEHEEKIVTEVLKCPITNIYGSREVGHVAAKCPHRSFHINQETHLVEIEKEAGSPEGNDVGEIVVTTLDRSPMPFIRYRMGDLGSVEKSQCACGRSLQVLSNLLGRTGEVFITKDGRMISPNFWCRTFMSGKVSGAVRRFQVIYTTTRDLKIRIEKDKAYTGETDRYIQEMVSKNFSADTKFKIEFVPRIEPNISGKYQMVVTERKA